MDYWRGNPDKKPLQMDQRFVVVATSDTILAPPNPKRRALLVGAPVPADTLSVNEGALVSGADTSTTGAKATYTVPAGVQATLTSATQFETTGTTVVSALRLTRGATTVNITSATNAGAWTGAIPLQAGDVVSWVVTTAVALSVTDYSINVTRDRVNTRVTLSFVGAAVLEQGLSMSPGTLPLYLHEDRIGSALTRDIHAIATPVAVTIPVVDIFDA